jgi:hypothetical protein
MDPINVTLRERDDVGFDVLCSDCRAPILEKVVTIREAYCRAREIALHKCEASEVAA